MKQRLQQTAQHTRITILSGILLVACGLILWHAINQNRGRVDERRQVVSLTVNNASADINQYLTDLSRNISLFAEARQELIKILHDHPYDQLAREKLRTALLDFFPHLHAFSLADKNGNRLLEDFQGVIDPACQADISRYSRTGESVPLKMHIDVSQPHYAIITPLQLPAGQSVYLLTSFYSDSLAPLLRKFTLPDYDLLIVNHDQANRVEISSKTDHKQLSSSEELSNEVREHIQARVIITNTNWDLVALERQDQPFLPMWSTALWAFSFLLLLGATALWFLRRSDSFIAIQSQQLKREQHRINHLQQTTISSELSFHEKVRALLIMGLEEYRMEVAILSHVENNRYVIVAAVTPDNTLHPGMSFSISNTYCHHTLTSGQPVGIAHIRNTETVNHPAFNKFKKITSYIGATVSVRGKSYGTLNFSSANPYQTEFAPEDFRFLLLMAQWIGLEIERRESEQQLQTKNQLLSSISRAQSYFITENVQTNAVFNQVLSDLLTLTFSNIGFIAETDEQNGVRQLRVLAITQRHYASGDLETFISNNLHPDKLHDPQNMVGEVLRTGAPVISNNLGSEANVSKLVDSTTAITTFIGAPFYHGTQLVGIFGLANSPDAYDESLLYMLAPLVTATANLIWALRNEQQRITTENAMRKSEEQLKLALEGANDGLWDWNIKTGQTYYSPRWQTMLGYTANDIAPHIQSKENLIHPDDLATVQKRMQQHIDGYTPIYQSEHRVKACDGEWHWILDRGKVVERNKLGRPIRAVGTHTDITERKAAEHALQERETRITAILETAVDGIVTINEQGIIETFNPAAEKIFGYTTQYVLGKNVNILMSTRDRDAHDDYIHRYLRTETPTILGKRREVMGQRADGSIFPMQLAVSEMFFGNHRYFTGIIRDITQVKDAEKLLQDTMALKQGILDSAKLSIISTDARGIIQSFNAAAQTMLGYSEREIVGKNTPTLFHDKDEIIQRSIRLSDELAQYIKPGFEVFIAKARAGVADEQQWTYIRKDGSRFPVLLTMTALHDKSDNTIGFVAMARDISRQQQAEEEISRFKTTLDMTLDCVFMFSPDTLRFFYFNQGAMSQVGYTYHELLHMTPIDLIPEFNQTSFRQLIKPMIAGERNAVTFETFHRNRNGGLIPVEIFLQYIYPVDQEPRFVAIVRDITERRRTAESLAQAEERARMLLESAGEGIYGLDMQGTTTFVNPAAARMLGYRPSDLIHVFMHATAHHTHTDGTAYVYETSPIYAAITQGVIQRIYEEIMWRKDGSSFPAEYTVTPIRKNNKISGAVVIFNDITERKRVEQIKNEFISTVSHELRTPLTSIRGSLGLLVGGAGGLLPNQAKNLVNIANKNTERLLLLINDILDIEKIESGKMVFHYKLLDLLQFLETATQANYAYGEQFAVSFHITQCPEGVSVYADEDRLLQVMNNLLSNAAKFSPRGGRVEISAVQRAHKVRISITDNGKGIPHSFQKDIFQKFAQADASDTRQLGGTGLGLSISKSIIDQHGGRIDFISRENLGTTFFFDLPEWTESQMDEPPKLDRMAKSRMLICEHDADIAYMLRIILAQAGYDCDVARTVEQAKQLITENVYLAVTLDIALPNEQGQTYDPEGIALIKEIRRTDSTRELPIIVLSATTDHNKRRLQCSAFGIVDWLDKPPDETRLLNAVQFITQHKQGLPRVLHVEDDPIIYEMVTVILRGQVNLVHAPSLADAHKKLREGRYDLILLDVELTDGSGLDLLNDLNQLDYTPQVVVFSAHEIGNDVAHMVKAALVKSRESRKELIHVIMSAIHERELPQTGT